MLPYKANVAFVETEICLSERNPFLKGNQKKMESNSIKMTGRWIKGGFIDIS